jgi:uncharacterized OsmC-like protein
MATITVTHLARDQFDVDIRGHRVLVDQPGHDDQLGPTPTELFVASLATCVGYFGARFLRERGLPYDGLRVDCDWKMLAARHPRVGRIQLSVTPPAEVPDELRAALQESLAHCTVHEALRQPPQVTITQAGVPAVAG